MKLPSIVRLARHQRFSITPRHYDPVKEEIEQRTMAIKRQLQEEGLISDDGTRSDLSSERRSTIRGSFQARSAVKDTPLMERSGLLRVLIFVIIVGGLGGYLYFGSEVIYYILYLAIGGLMWVMLKRLKRRNQNE